MASSNTQRCWEVPPRIQPMLSLIVEFSLMVVLNDFVASFYGHVDRSGSKESLMK
ncbi:transmembrane protein, putative [Medicago truncatula]|uniref:Transmembrane protein, putative n=1 Tax=Medicago truncatula TaxID=3880 RepID=A0A072V6Q0_MEDTR|nr:transmembrane protein, putative [Medicago truncatula]